MKYTLLIPIVGILMPPYIKDWEKISRGSLLFTISFIIQIISLSYLTFLAGKN